MYSCLVLSKGGSYGLAPSLRKSMPPDCAQLLELGTVLALRLGVEHNIIAHRDIWPCTPIYDSGIGITNKYICKPPSNPAPRTDHKLYVANDYGYTGAAGDT